MSVRTAACLFFFLTTFRVCNVFKLLRLNLLCVFAQIQQIFSVFISLVEQHHFPSFIQFLYCLKIVVNFFISSSVVSPSFFTDTGVSAQSSCSAEAPPTCFLTLSANQKKVMLKREELNSSFQIDSI